MPRHWDQFAAGAWGIDWTDAAATARFDPCLAWLETINFAARGIEPGGRIPVAIELNDNSESLLADMHDRGLLWVAPIWRDKQGALRHCTALVAPASLRDLDKAIIRVEPGLVARPRPPGTTQPPLPPLPVDAATDHGGHSKPEACGRNVIAIIDDGCAFAHPQFRNADQRSTRICRIWDQGRAGSGEPWSTPAEFGYGMEADRAGLQQLLAELQTDNTPAAEKRCYAAAGVAVPQDQRPWHGTHVMDLACGFPDPMNPTSTVRDAAADADILFVQLPSMAVGDHGGGWLRVHVLDALRYIVRHTDKADNVVVNLSFGAHAGPHDGSTLIEQAIDDLIERERPHNFAVVVAAGNSFDLDGHAELSIDPGETKKLDWFVPPDDATDSFLEIWLPSKGAAGQETSVGIEVTPPEGGKGSGLQKPGCAVRYCVGDQPAAVAMLLYARQTTAGRGDLLAFVAVAPTTPVDGYGQTADAGCWRIELKNAGNAAVTVHAWIERDAEAVGFGGNQSVFLNHIETSCTLSSLACGRHSIVVGGITQGSNPPAYSRFASSGPARHAGGRMGPDVAAPADRFDEATGRDEPLEAAGPLSGSRAFYSGTSMAAAQVSRRVMNILAARGAEYLTRDQVLQRLLPDSAERGNPQRGRPI